MITSNELNEFVGKVNAMLASHNESHGYQWKTFVEASIGKKYARIVKREKHGDHPVNGGSAFCFVEMETGNILKAAGWAAPAKGVRGNIANGLAGLTPYGAVYNNR